MFWLTSLLTEFDWKAFTVLLFWFWANACGVDACVVSALATAAVANTEIAAISAVVVFRDNIVCVNKGIIYLRCGAE
jgi:hypothetical protein